MSPALAGPTARPVSQVEHCMGTVFSFRVPPPGVDAAALAHALRWLHRVDATFSTYRTDSDISRLNTGHLRLADASKEVRHVLEECERAEQETDGYFDAHPRGALLDPSGYVKGWAIQRAAEILAEAGSVNHCVNGGGDVVCAGRPQAGRGWRIGVCDPHSRGALLTTVEATGPVAVATSGLAERGAHIYEPHTGRPALETASVTVVAADVTTADVYATAAVAMGPARAARWLALQTTMRAVIVSRSGTSTYVGGWPEHERPAREAGATPADPAVVLGGR